VRPAAPRATRRKPAARGSALPQRHDLALGFLAMLPLFALYEFGWRASGGATRNLAEVVLCLPLAPLGDALHVARPLALVALAALAAWRVFHAELGLGPRLFRIALEGLACALLLGPLLIGVLALCGGLDALRDVALPQAPAAPGLAQVALLAGGGSYEELLFRLGLQSLLYFLFVRALRFWMPDGPLLRGVSEVATVALAALAFAAAHLAVFTQVLGPGGEPWHAGVFHWRVLAGILLALVFRWRGPGVAAWAHAWFNAALAIGVGPEVFL